MTINKCDICGAEWDPQSQTHRRGPDCASGLKSEIDRVNGSMEVLKNSYHDHVKKEEDATERFLKAVEEIAKSVRGVNERVEAVAKRVNLIEHPNLQKVPSMPKRT